MHWLFKDFIFRVFLIDLYGPQLLNSTFRTFHFDFYSLDLIHYWDAFT